MQAVLCQPGTTWHKVALRPRLRMHRISSQAASKLWNSAPQLFWASVQLGSCVHTVQGCMTGDQLLKAARIYLLALTMGHARQASSRSYSPPKDWAPLIRMACGLHQPQQPACPTRIGRLSSDCYLDCTSPNSLPAQAHSG